ncbi:tape measure protein [Klebsiella quasipneumoniae subsp. quasipneumoniae]|uniref:tape measure protein n=4 Tax=Klebsiella pneumoniae complex TaxID=3390273 RepID=UPI00292BA7AE|nr:tape measure protein [Klebsiella quasipneumoniae]MDV1504825.1 tape measure protein [Klebsiella quasipneumoniae subsp. quasipneumoniae]MDV1519707.1 tape measure protein [Klebsiella quasipneumoniae subsp. quasipneumoniae]MDV1556874.1 tape measure protein [Klebsiella quasipneumoniae subsp. quasipneumoniae]MDV1579431.1 tape measure protein [Klebsiella quasipneumoniae subsp. quasipneumoniae]MDW2622928.1 tape measure protein [Klebsiella quasipneumoniae]
MAGTFDAGSVVYEVDMDTSRLLAARREVDAALNGLNGSMGRLEASVNRTERSIGSMERTMSSLSGVAKGLLAALSVQQVASYADAWTELNNKVANSVRTGETQAEVMQRIFDVSQATQSSLNGTATLYARLERGTRTYNTSAEDLTRLTTIINQGFAVSGATAQEAENAIIQLSQGIASGVLRGEEFNSVSEQGSRLMVALADSMGVSIGQLRAMAAQGQLTTDVVVKGLLSQGDAIGKEFANTTVSIAKGLQVAGNNITKFFGENSTVKSFAAGFRDSVITISENLETLGTALIGAAAIMGGRFAGALAMATAAQASRVKATIQGIVATRQSAQQEAAAASVTARKAAADKDAALSALNVATAEYNVAKGSAAEAFALENVIRLRGIYVATSAEAALANNALAASQAKVAATGITFANTMKVVNAVTAPLGGPIGVIAIVAAGWYLYSQRQAEARKEAIAFADTVPDVIKRLKDMNLAQAQGVRADTVTSIEAQKEAISDLKDTISGLQSDYEKYTTLARQYGVTEDQNNGFVIKAKDAANELTKKRRDLDGATATLKQTEDALHLINIQVNQGIVDQMRAARDNAIAIAEAEKQASFLGGTQAFLAEKLGQSTQALKAFNSESLKINWGGKEGEKLIKQAERRLALSKLEGEAKARQQAAYDAEDAGVTDERAIKRLQDNYAATERNTQARKDQKKEDNAAASEAKKLANQQESVAQKLANLKQQSELAAGSTQELSREQAMLRAEQSLGKSASADQVQQARNYAAAVWDTAAAIKARNAVPELKENADYNAQKSQLETLKDAKDAQGNLIISQQQYNQASEQLEQQHQVNLAKIRAGQVVTPQQQAQGEIDPVQRLANQHAQELALIQQFETQKGQITQRGLELMNAANTQYEQQRIAAQWALFTQQSVGYEALGAAVDAFGSQASNALTGVITGSMSANDALRSIGNTILNDVINTFVQMGMQQAKSAIMGATAQNAAIATTTAAQVSSLATTTAASTSSAAATTAAWTPAALVASIGSFGGAVAIGLGALVAALAVGSSLAGKRKNGGPVSAGSMYQVGEDGKPEIYQASTGKQYMIPGDNGKVISNKDLQGSGGGTLQVVNNVYNYANGVNVDTRSSQNGGQLVIETFITDMQTGGPMSSQMQDTFGLRRQAHGDY